MKLCTLFVLAVPGSIATTSEQFGQLEHLGHHTFPVTTTSKEAQSSFDRGLMLAYSFGHYAAEQKFRRAPVGVNVPAISPVARLQMVIERSGVEHAIGAVCGYGFAKAASRQVPKDRERAASFSICSKLLSGRVRRFELSVTFCTFAYERPMLHDGGGALESLAT